MPVHAVRTVRLLLVSGLLAAPTVALLGADEAPSPAAPTIPAIASQPAFAGHDPFDDVRTLGALVELEREVEAAVAQLRPSVVMLRIRGDGRRGGVSTGTGVIISADGLVATCGHVGQRPGRSVTATLADGTELRGRTLGQVFEGAVDCGLVQLETDGVELPAAAVGTTRDLAPGDWVIAMGYTHGLREDPRPALARVGRVLEARDDGLFFDAPIDAGDSGGPSFNLRGEVVGLNSRCGRWSWQNLATPIDRLVERMKTLAAEDGRDDEPAIADEATGDATAADDAASDPRRVTEPEPRRRAAPAPRRRERDDPVRFPEGTRRVGKLALERAMPLAGELGDTVAEARRSMVRVRSDNRIVAYGAVVDASGLVVTKASQLDPGASIVVELAGRERRRAEVVASDEETDLALLQLAMEAHGTVADRLPDLLPALELEPVEWAVDAPVAPGSVVLSPRLFGEPPLLGFVAIEQRETVEELIDGPYLGVQSRPADRERLERAGAAHGVTIVRVMPGTPAESAGLENGDLILAVNGEPVRSPDQLARALRRHDPGEAVELAVVDVDGERTLEATLARRGDLDRRLRRGNTATPVSRRSSGLGALVAHDAVAEPEEMGGLLLDLDGRVVGLNIARYDRTATHAIPADRVAEACRRMVLESGSDEAR